MGTTGLRDAGLGIAGALVGLTTIALVPTQVPGQTIWAISDPSSPVFFPIMAALALVACSLLLVISSIRPHGGGEACDKLITLRFIGTGALLTAYLAAIDLLGMYIATPLMIVGLSVAFGYRNWTLVAGSALLMPLLIWLLFQKALVIVFPSGVLF